MPAPSSARALWYIGDGRADLRAEPLPAPGRDETTVRMLYSGVSRGTERLVCQALVPASEYARMRGPNMGGAFPHPVKYGYQGVGVAEDGPLVGRTVFALHPHQDRFVLPTESLTPLPDGVPARRGVLAANMETALNALWDSGAGPGDRIAIVGAGVVGCLIAALAGALPGAEATLIDPLAERAATAAALGVGYAPPDGAPEDRDLVFHASANPKGLETALEIAGFEGTVVEVSWFGDREVAVPLGRRFHSGRLKLISSQVGHVAASRRPRWDHRRRMAKAMELLVDPRLDALLGEDIPFEDSARLVPQALLRNEGGLAPVIGYR